MYTYCNKNNPLSGYFGVYNNPELKVESSKLKVQKPANAGFCLYTEGVSTFNFKLFVLSTYRQMIAAIESPARNFIILTPCVDRPIEGISLIPVRIT
ncbi:MAG: hypothetical protein UU98_C0004G0018 [Parcubacteria group bacterium GW2011_GWD2_42_14]|nr:MAG: hypothetical protein UU98_C0004G0018 [Parcubacteria group bacterium GW2011_GWD2_42_14]